MNRRPPSALIFAACVGPLALAALAAACGATPEPTSPEGIPLVAPPAARPGAPGAPADAPAAASASPAASTAAGKPPPSPGGAPMAVVEGDVEITTAIGYRGGKLRLTSTGAELSLPSGSLSDGLAFSFAAAPARGPQPAPPHRGALGLLYRFAIRRVEGGEAIGSTVTGATTPITSEGPPFVLKLPLPPNAKAANLAVGTSDGKKVTYKVYPSSSVESGDPAKAVFSMPALPGEGVLHLTSAEPTEKR